MQTANALYTRKTFYRLPVEFRIGAIVSDGMWYSLPKWRKLAKCSEEEITEFIERKLATGELVQSSAGAKSYRLPLESIEKWYDENNIEFKTQIIDFLFPPRIWDGMTEVEGFELAPLRTISVVTFNVADSRDAKHIIDGLRGVARVREVDSGSYKAYGLDSSYIKARIEEISEGRVTKTYARVEAKRRELVDFPKTFANNLMGFYSKFGRTLVRPAIKTIEIFIPDPLDQQSQIDFWVLSAIEKFDEKSAVPFSGYLHSALRHWPYDLPAERLGKDLSSFQRERAKAIKRLGGSDDENRITVPHEAIAKELSLPLDKFLELEEKHQIWLKSQNASTLTWTESSEEKQVESNLSGNFSGSTVDTDVELANTISRAVIHAALESNSYGEAFFVISQIDTPELDVAQLRNLSAPFVKALTSQF